MAVSIPWKLDRIILPSSVEFSIVKNARWVAGISDLIERPAGHPHPMFTANMTQKPAFDFTTTELGVLLGAIGVGGASLGTVDTYFKKGAVTGSVARATTEHKRVRITASCGYWTSIKLPHNGVGEASVMVQANYDGTNDPLLYGGSVALPGNLAAGTYFGAGPVSINGTSYGTVQEISIDSGIKLLQLGGESERFDTFVGIEQTDPVVTIKFLEAINWATIGLEGTALNGSTGLTFYARAFASNGSRIANATTSHIKFVCANGHAKPVDSSGQGTSPITDTVKFVLTAASDSTVPIAGTVGSAIT